MTLRKWLTWRRRREDDLQAEIASHIALATQERIAQGQDPEAARRGALKEFGNVTLTREATKLTWGGLWIERVGDVVRDARYAVRLLVRSPAYTLIVITVLALGIGTNVIAFALFKALALTPLPGVADAHSPALRVCQSPRRRPLLAVLSGLSLSPRSASWLFRVCRRVDPAFHPRACKNGRYVSPASSSPAITSRPSAWVHNAAERFCPPMRSIRAAIPSL